MKRVPGHSFEYKPGVTIREDFGDDTTTTTTTTSSSSSATPGASYNDGPLKHLGPGYESVIAPALPTRPLAVSPGGPVAMCPTLAAPLLKAEDGDVAARQSGRRSAIANFRLADDVAAQGSGGGGGGKMEWFRLKGCGDLYLGFPVIGVDNTAYVQVRGCTFEQTCMREQYLTSLVASVGARTGFSSVNYPIGWFEYDSSGFQFPKIKKMCALYVTKGEKRLSDHILNGLENIIPNLIENLDIAPFKEMFPPERINGGEVEPTETPTLAAQDQLRDFTTKPLSLHAVPFPATLNTKWQTLWAECNAKLPTGPTTALTYLYWRLGREVGHILRALHDNEISWGTYSDLLGFHCNAHPNNLAALYNREPCGMFLGPLDFDMAFTGKSWLKGMQHFQETLLIETNAMALGLAGDPLINTGLIHHTTLAGDFQTLKWCLRDTLVKGFLSGYQREADSHPIDGSLDAQAEALVRLALMSTVTYIA
ncbi:Adenylyltransferase and sulfurtransferase MOCS3-1 [Pelomyxa schiedti]|nr:Adenylyltransferase and sulfurtransferase MOCS3-1 [Pelomyxa schiedti]